MKFKHLALLCLFIFGQSSNVYAENEFKFVGKVAKEVAALVVATGVFVGVGIKVVYDFFKTKNKDENQVGNLQEEAKYSTYASAVVVNEQHEKYKTKITHILCEESHDLKELFTQYEKIVDHDIRYDGLYDQYLGKRRSALSDHFRHNQEWRYRTFTVSEEAQYLLQENHINAADYINYYGNCIQLELHQEFLDIIHGAVDVNQFFNNNNESKTFVAALTKCADTGQHHNHAGRIVQAYSFADYCHGILRLTAQVTWDITYAVGKGSAQGVYNFSYKVAHPVETTQNAAKGTASLIKTLAYIDQRMQEITLKNIHKAELRRQQDQADIASGRVTEAELKKRYWQEFKDTCSYNKHLATKSLMNAWKRVDYETMLLGIEKSTEIIIDTALTSAALGALGSLTENTSINLSNSLNNASVNFTDLPLDPGSMATAVYYDAALADVMCAGATTVEAIGVVAADVLDGAAKLTPALSLMQNGPGDGGQSNLSTGKGVVPSAPTDALEAVHKFTDIEYAQLQYNYDGKIIHNGRPVTFNYRHVFEGEPYKSGKNFGGLHQDRLGDLRRQGFSRVVKMDPSGFNEVEVLFNGRWIRTTNFPDHWDYDEIMKCVFEVFNRGKIVEADGIRTVYEDLFFKDVKIRIVVEDATGLCITFYPRLLS